MNRRSCRIIIIAVSLLLGGCTSFRSRAVKICPGKNSVSEAIAALRKRSEKITAIKANGICDVKFFDRRGKAIKESFPVRIWAEPPRQICLHADILFNPAAIIAGANEREFWLCSTLLKYYAWGRFDGDGSITFVENVPPVLLSFSPQLLFEAMGLVNIENPSRWTLQNDGNSDILEKSTIDGKIIKRIHINTCDYTVRAVEYLNRSGRVIAFIELDDYKIIADELTTPHKIAIVQSNAHGVLTSVTIKLSKIQLIELSDRQRKALFNRPKPDGFDKVLKITE